MKLKKIAWLVLLLVGVFILFGCLHDYRINFPADSSSVVGMWVLSSAPKAVKDCFQGRLPNSTLILHTNGTATYSLVPIDLNRDAGGGPSVPSQWFFSSGENTWRFRDWGYKGWHIWRVDLDTEKIGIQLTLERKLFGKMILIYEPDPNSDEEVIFQRPLKDK